MLHLFIDIFDNTGKSKICYFCNSIFQQDVCGLDVAVDYVLLLQNLEPIADVTEERKGLGFAEIALFFCF